MRTFILTSIVFLLLPRAYAQNSFQRIYGTSEDEVGYFINHTKHKGYIVSAIERTNGSLKSSYIIKLDSLGEKVWSFKLKSIYVNTIASTSDGGYIMTASRNFQSTTQSYLFKLNASGNIEWQRKYNPSYEFFSVNEDISGGGYVVSGRNTLMKVGYDGVVKWVRILENTLNLPTMAYDFVQLPSDSCFYVLSRTDWMAAMAGWFMVTKLTKDGTKLWVKRIAKDLGLFNYNPPASHIEQLYNGNLLVGFQDKNKLFFKELDTAGTISNQVFYEYPLNYKAGWSLADPKHNRNLVLGAVDNHYQPDKPADILFTKTDAAYQVLWTKKIGGTSFEDVSGLITNEQKQVAMIGSTYSFSQGLYDIYFLKSDSSASFGCHDVPSTIHPILNFSSDTSKIITSSPANFKLVDSLVNDFPDVIGESSFNACGCIHPISVFFTTSPNYTHNYSTGGTSYFWDFGNGMTDTSFAPLLPYKVNGLYQVCLTVTSPCGTDSVCHMIDFKMATSISDLKDENAIIIYPNPFSSQTIIQFEKEQHNIQLRLIDLLGRELQKIAFSGKEFILNRGEIQDGIYFLEFSDERGNRALKKIVIE